MRIPAHRLLAMIATTAVAAVSSATFAQTSLPTQSVRLAQAAPPTRETPRPEDIDPGVNTSAPAAEPTREAPRPQDINPGVDTSATPPAEEAGRPSTPAPAAPTDSSQSGQSGAAAQAPKAAPRSRGADRLELDTTQITGNRELPKVLYIVPWKRSDLGDLVGRPVNSLLDEVLTPVDRDVFKRENRYYRALTPGADEGAATGPPVKPAPQRAKPSNPVTPAGSPGSANKAPAGGSATPPPASNEPQ